MLKAISLPYRNRLLCNELYVADGPGPAENHHRCCATARDRSLRIQSLRGTSSSTHSEGWIESTASSMRSLNRRS